MGYTHYWTQKETLNQGDWALVIEDARAVFKKTVVPVAREYDQLERLPQLDGEIIRFNGAGDAGCETFYLTRQRRAPYEYETFKDVEGGAFSFCKTRAEPYDILVTAILACLAERFPDVFSVSSDGEPEDWQEGITLASEATGRAVPIPSDVIN